MPLNNNLWFPKGHFHFFSVENIFINLNNQFFTIKNLLEWKASTNLKINVSKVWFLLKHLFESVALNQCFITDSVMLQDLLSGRTTYNGKKIHVFLESAGQRATAGQAMGLVLNAIPSQPTSAFQRHKNN